jgi:hypothetical protein
MREPCPTPIISLEARQCIQRSKEAFDANGDQARPLDRGLKLQKAAVALSTSVDEQCRPKCRKRMFGKLTREFGLVSRLGARSVTGLVKLAKDQEIFQKLRDDGTISPNDQLRTAWDKVKKVKKTGMPVTCATTTDVTPAQSISQDRLAELAAELRELRELREREGERELRELREWREERERREWRERNIRQAPTGRDSPTDD